MTLAFFHKCVGYSLFATSVTHILSFHKLTLKPWITAPLGSPFLARPWFCSSCPPLPMLPNLARKLSKLCLVRFQWWLTFSSAPSHHLSILGSDLVVVFCRVCFQSLLISLKPSHTVYMIFINSPEPFHVQGQERWLHFTGCAVWRYPMSKVRKTPVRR